jgi:hypothetical protein
MQLICSMASVDLYLSVMERRQELIGIVGHVEGLRGEWAGLRQALQPSVQAQASNSSRPEGASLCLGCERREGWDSHEHSQGSSET